MGITKLWELKREKEMLRDACKDENHLRIYYTGQVDIIGIIIMKQEQEAEKKI